MYQRKTVDLWDIEGYYGDTWECVTTETNYKEAKANLRAYRENEASTCFRLRKYRERIES